MQINFFQLQMKSMVMFLFMCAFLLSAINQKHTYAQRSKKKIYTAVLTNQSYTVGSENPGTGLFVGNEDGSHWKNIAFPNMRTFAIEVFPDYKQGLIYTANGNGVIVSRDGGKDWRVTTGWQITEVLEVAAVPDNPKIVYVGSAYGVYKSTEFGENFQQLTERFVAGLHIDIDDPDRIYVGEEDGLIISKDGGQSFKKIKEITHAVNAFGQDFEDPDRIYIGTEDQGIFISENRGQSWKNASDYRESTIYSIAIDPNNPDRVFVSTYENGILRSEDRRQSWESLQNGLENIACYEVTVHPDHSNILYAGTVDRGIFRSTDNGASWESFALDGTHVLELEIK